jgi:hypothetical protein
MPDSLTPLGPAASPATTLEWGLYYAARGWSVVPVRSGEKLPAIPWAKHQSQPADAALIRTWLDNPAMGLGLVQGRHVGTIVLDFDGEVGLATLESLEARGLPTSTRQFTPRGGVHVVLTHPGRHVPTRKNVLPGMDVRGDGGFIVCCPSLGANGNSYAWDVDAHPEEAPLADLPEWLVETVCGPVEGGTDLPGQIVRAPLPASGFDFGRELVTDGRETYMRNTILAVLREMRDSLGRVPTEKELVEAAWPQYQSHVDLSRAGRGYPEFVAKARYTLARVAQGLVKGVDATPATPPREEPAHDPETGEILGEQPETNPPNPPKLGRAIRLLTMAEVEAMPPPQWLIHGVLPRAGLVIPYGPPKAGKTFLVTAWALHVAAGLEWCGRPVTQGAVVYVVGEGLGGFAARLAVMREAYGIPSDAPFYVVPRAVNFRDDESVKQLVAAIEAALPTGITLALIVLDTLARAMPGVDENSAQEVGLVIARCDAVKEHFGATVCPVHHTGKDTERGMRGSNALLGAVDASYLIQRAGKNVVRLKNDAMKDAEEFPDMLFDMEQVHVGLRSSLVPRLRDTSQGRPVAPDKPTPDQIRNNVIVALKGNGTMPFRRVAEVVGMISGNARQELQSLIPLGKEDALAITRNGSTILLWRSIDGDHKTAAQLIHAETTYADE